MRTSRILSGVATALPLMVAMLTLSASAQNLYQLRFKGTASSVDASGKEVTRTLTDRILVREWAHKAGVSNLNNLVLALRRNVDSRGDMIEVVNRKDGSVVATPYALFYPETATAASVRGASEKRFAYVFNLSQAEFSRGTAVFSQQTVVNKQGVTNRFAASGEMQWYELPQGGNAFQIRSGKFTAVKSL